MTDAMPRQDLKLPPPIGYISREEHAALIQEAVADALHKMSYEVPDHESSRIIEAKAASIRAANGHPMTLTSNHLARRIA